MDKFIIVRDKIIIKESEIVAIRQKGEDVVISTSGDDFLIVKASLEEFSEALKRENIERDHEWEKHVDTYIEAYNNILKDLNDDKNVYYECDEFKKISDVIIKSRVYEKFIEDLENIKRSMK